MMRAVPAVNAMIIDQGSTDRLVGNEFLIAALEQASGGVRARVRIVVPLQDRESDREVAGVLRQLRWPLWPSFLRAFNAE